VGEDRQRNWGFFCDLVRGVSNAREGSKILTFLLRPRLVCNSLLHLRSSWRDCPKRGTNPTLSVDLGGVGRPRWVEKYPSGAP
jgi:hypothetical protein